MNFKQPIATFVFLALLIGFAPPVFAIDPASPGALDSSVQADIKAKADRLQRLYQETQAAQSSLNQVQSQKTSLQRELKTLDGSIKVLDLSIQTDNVQTEQLGLQINSLQDELDTMGRAMDDKRANIMRLFRELQKTDGENLVTTLLSNNSLTEILNDAQSIESLRSQLAIDIVNLNQLSDEYRQKVSDMSDKKSEVVLHLENLKNRKVIVQDQKAQRQTILAVTKNQESVYQDKIAKLKAEQDALEDEISQMESQLSQNFNSNVLPPKIHGILAWPVKDPRITQHFGERSYLYRGKPHNGVDLAASIGTPIFAAADGIIVAVDNNDRSSFNKYQYGRYVLIRHPNGLATIYGHLSRQVVSPGQLIKRGDLIGYSGSTGYATGPHLHFGLYWYPTMSLKRIPPAAGLVPVGVVLNPEDYL